jgi:hypothetical protein
MTGIFCFFYFYAISNSSMVEGERKELTDISFKANERKLR